MNNHIARWSRLALIGLTSCLGAADLVAAPREVEPKQQWHGRLADHTQMRAASEVITGKEQLEKLWKEWRAGEKLPEVDFTKELVLAHTSLGTAPSLRISLDDQGDLRATVLPARTMRPSFHYFICTVSREGVKTYNGKPLPAAAPAGEAAKAELPKPGEVTWEELKRVIKEGKVLSVGQTHSRRVTVVVEGNQQYHATEPQLDDVIKYVRELGKNVPIMTE